MPAVPLRTFERWLRRLDEDAFTAFLADLYASRGRAVTVRDDGAVVLSDEGRVLAPVASAWRLRNPRLPADADAVVAARPTPRIDRLAAREGLPLVGPADLRNVALYGIDRRDAERLFAAHFDASPVVAGPVPAHEGDDGVLAGMGDVSAASVAAVVIVALVVAALLGPFGPGVSPAANDAGQAESGPVVVGPSVPTDDGAESALFPPGIGATGVTDAEALADAHADAVAGRSYRIVLRQSGTRDWSGRVWRGVWQQAEVEDPRHFRYTVTGYARDRAAESRSGETPANDTDDDGDELVQYTAYADGEQIFVRVDGRNESFYRYPVRIDENGHGLFEQRASAAVERYLNASRTRVRRVDDTRYPFRVVATGTPESVPRPANVSDYRAEASVGSDGFVSVLVVSYDRTVGDETREVSYRMEYASMDAVTVSRPGWYDRAVNATAPDAAAGVPVSGPTDADGTAGNATTANETATNETAANGTTTTTPTTDEPATGGNGTTTESATERPRPTVRVSAPAT
jgi:hypothetical protein